MVDSKLAGHLPAEKVGGVRVMRKERRQQESENQPTSSEGSSSTEKSDELLKAENVLANSGVVTQIANDYPEAAVKHCHEKAVPRHQVHNNAALCHRSTGPIFQPSKN
ncbi:hypothetical protein PMAYCL1PPCAC_15406 [Pristionchus mayeri]|uniref:Uncharacterized protein n=1 Tax=Pristionchus mayeri TaxID=1317129 RepID=A0AAN5HYK1_9BILA|nr:hypothetical protein PMAYCL1PPCAC_15406 [Pristionchus mayeri]